MFVAATDFGLEDFTFAIGAYGPSAAGSQSYDVRGGSRWMLTELDAVMVYYSAAVAYGKSNWGVGMTLQVAHQPSTRLALVVDGTTGGAQSPYSSAADVLATIDLSAPPTFSAIIGAWWQPQALRTARGFWEFAVSARVLPVSFKSTGDVTMSNTPGGSQFSASQLEVSDSSAALDLVLPPVVRAGLRYVHLSGGRELFDIEFNAVYERWSMLDSYNLDLEGTINLFAAAEAPDVIIAKNWQDTLALRLGGTYNVTETFGVSLGGYYESAAVPVNYSHLDFPSFARVGLGIGVQGQAFGLQWSVAYAHVFQETRDVDERYAKVLQQRPIAECPEGCDGFDAVPANAGLFETGFSTISVSLSYGF